MKDLLQKLKILVFIDHLSCLFNIIIIIAIIIVIIIITIIKKIYTKMYLFLVVVPMFFGSLFLVNVSSRSFKGHIFIPILQNPSNNLTDQIIGCMCNSRGKLLQYKKILESCDGQEWNSNICRRRYELSVDKIYGLQ